MFIKKNLNLVKYVLFILLILGILFAFLEGIARIYLYFVSKCNKSVLDTLPMAIPNQNRIFELKPNYHQKYKSSEFQIDIKTNKDGLRDINHSYSKPQNVLRVLALGDSFTFGWGVGQNNTWWKLLENELNNHRASKYKYEVINLGVWMYTYDQQFLRLKDKGLKYHPDIVIQGIYWPHLRTISTHNWETNSKGDLIRVTDPTIYISKKGLLKAQDKNSLINFCKTHSKFLNIMISKLQIVLSKKHLTSGDLVFLGPDSVSKYSDTWSKALKSIYFTEKLLEQRNIQYLVFLIPRDVQVSKEEWIPLYKNAMDRQLYKETIPQKIFTNFCNKKRISCLDLLPIFQENYSPELYFPIDPHWTEKGHKLASEILYQFIKTLELKKYPYKINYSF